MFVIPPQVNAERPTPCRRAVLSRIVRACAVVAMVCVVVAIARAPARAATVLFSPFDTLEGWSVRTLGAANATVADDATGRRFLEVTADGGTVLVSRELPLAEVAGCRLSIRCLVDSRDVVRGPQISSTGKIHLAVQTPGGVSHFAARFDGTSEWHSEGFEADIPADATRVLLNLGLEACSGAAGFSRLVVTNDRRGVHMLDMAEAVNANHEQLGIGAFPEQTVTFDEVPFRILDAAEHQGLDCLRLRSVQHPDWPPATAAPIEVGCGASAIYILHATVDGEGRSDSPCAIWSARFVGGQSAGLSLFEGREIGAMGARDDLENWKVAWKKKDDEGNWITFGVTKWTVYSDMPVESLSCRAYRGAAPVVLAVTVVEQPPEPEPEYNEFDEMGEGWEE